MDYRDYRHVANEQKEERAGSPVRKYFGKRFDDLVGELIREAEAQGKFDNLPGQGKPLNLEDNPYVGDRAMGYHLLKSNGYAPREIELVKEIRRESEQAEAKLEKYRHQSRVLRARRIPPFASEKRAFNAVIEKASGEYEKTLRELNRKILTLNLTAPTALHMAPFQVEKLAQQFRRDCPGL